jgi:DNA-binding MltR family transcriptional regulator
MKSTLTILVFVIAILGILALLRFQYNSTVKQIWQNLKSQSNSTVFTQEMIADLPEPVQRYFLHAIAIGTPLYSFWWKSGSRTNF